MASLFVSTERLGTSYGFKRLGMSGCSRAPLMVHCAVDVVIPERERSDRANRFCISPQVLVINLLTVSTPS